LTTLSIVSLCWGEDYAKFIPRFWQGVESLNRKPDEIVLGVEADDKTGFAESAPEGYNIKIHVFESDTFQWRWYETLMQATSEWQIGCAVDDELLPGAFDELDLAAEQGAEIYADSIIIRESGERVGGRWDTSNLQQILPCPGGAATTTELFRRIGMKPEFRWVDWVFYIDAVKAGAKPYISNTTRMIYDDGRGRQTWSSVSMDSNVRQSYSEQVAAYARSLGF